ncbi:MAG TPA: tetratricopeptide repeat protein [Chitinophagaceae bacterium]|nr:tetratricopeptide repeat protein [Chitinophagaceae bacterium]
MKKTFFYSFLLVLFIAAAAFILTCITKPGSKNETVYKELLPRKTSLAYAAEWAVVKNNVDVLIRKIDQDPSDIKSLLGLTAQYIQEGRNTGNFNYYNEAALRCINTVLEKDAKSFEALTFKATILLSQHRFAEGLQIATQAQQLYPYNAYVHGLLVDGYVETGKYKEAIEAADKMISIRPDNRSYSRIAYLREIHGDIAGAIEAMKMGVDAGAPGDENTEWCRVQLGKLFEKAGKISEAKMHYTISVDNRKNYPYALAGLARIAAEENDYTKALGLYMQADSLIPDHTFKEGIAEIYNLTGQTEKAKMVAEEILNYMKNFLSAGENKNVGQNEDHEMAHAYMGVNNYEKALEYALVEYNRRPENIEANETVAIVYYAKGEYAKALPYIETALKTNCKNPELLCQAGLIYAKSGGKTKAKMFLKEALKNDPLISASLKTESKEMLISLK